MKKILFYLLAFWIQFLSNILGILKKNNNTKNGKFQIPIKANHGFENYIMSEKLFYEYYIWENIYSSFYYGY